MQCLKEEIKKQEKDKSVDNNKKVRCVWKLQYCYTQLCPKILGRGQNINCSLDYDE